VKSLIKRGLFGPRVDASSMAVVESIPDPVCDLIRRGSLSIGMADLDRGLSHPVSSTSGISKSELGYFRRVKDKVAKQLIKRVFFLGVGRIRRCWTCSLPGRGRLKG
jgi:hypothetical protein